jgi:hypothetical protein
VLDDSRALEHRLSVQPAAGDGPDLDARLVELSARLEEVQVGLHLQGQATGHCVLYICLHYARTLHAAS